MATAAVLSSISGFVTVSFLENHILIFLPVLRLECSTIQQQLALSSGEANIKATGIKYKMALDKTTVPKTTGSAKC